MFFAYIHLCLCAVGYVPKPEIGEKLWKAPGYSEDDIKTLLKKQDLTVEELEVAIYEAGERNYFSRLNSLRETILLIV